MSKRSWLGASIDQPHLAERGGEPQLHAGVAASLLDVAGRAVDVQVRFDPGLQRSPRLVGVDQPGPVVAPLGQRALEHADVLERAELVVDGAAVIAVAVELEWGEAQR